MSELLENVDIVSPNETELDRMAGDGDGSTDEKIKKFMESTPGMNVLFKRGAQGASYFGSKSYMDAEMEKDDEPAEGQKVEQPAYKFEDYAGRA